MPIGDSREGTLRTLKSMLEHRRHKTGMMTTPYAESGGFWTVTEDAPAPDIQWHFVPAMLEDHGREKVKGHGFSLHTCVLRPASRGTVRLASAQAQDAPAIDPNFLDDESDIATLRAGRAAVAPHRRGQSAAALQTARSPSGRSRRRRRARHADPRACRHRLSPGGHLPDGGGFGQRGRSAAQGGGESMGLWIADASIMPRLISGNTNAASIMIGERCAEFVREAMR